MNNRKELIYNIRDIFTSVVGKGAPIKEYYVPEYQRSYKWSSDNAYAPVPQLLLDIYSAYTQKIEEYYLQYITVKKDPQKRFEVIDGQQRLTTLSLILYRYSALKKTDNIAEDKLIYSRYRDSIFDWVNDNISIDLKNILSQDKYYFVNAAKCIDSFFELLDKYGEEDGYIEYLKEHVKIILNEESEFVSSEESFANLNDNKVELTDSYLIKGLLLTLSTRYSEESGKANTYREVMDQRSIKGRMWDEIQSWINQPRVSLYFFGDERNGMKHLLNFLSKKRNFGGCIKGTSQVVEDFKGGFDKDVAKEREMTLFNLYNEVVKTEDEARTVLEDLVHVYRKFRGLYDNIEDNRLFNKMGYIMFSNDLGRDKLDRGELLKGFVEDGTDAFNQKIKDYLLKKVPDMLQILEEDAQKSKNTGKQISRLDYKSGNPYLINLLLAYSVFPEGEEKGYRFDFYEYKVANWSLEHIYPQNPGNNIKIPDVSYPVVMMALKTQYRKKLANLSKTGPDYTKEKEFEKYKVEAKELFWNKKVNSDSILFSEVLGNENFYGNMALLSGGVNASLSNKPYVAKRPLLLDNEKRGKFIPRHTIDIFNKTLPAKNGKALNPDLMVWDENEVNKHANWMRERNVEIRNEIQK